MSSLLSGYDLSILSILVYYALSMFPHGYAAYIATQGKMESWDNRNPRSTTMKAKLKAQLPAEVYAKYERLESCHNNGMENLPLFASAVIIGNFAGLTKDDMNAFVASFLMIRVAYTVVYATHTTQGMTHVRSGLWFVGIGLCFRTIVRAAGAIGVRA